MPGAGQETTAIRNVIRQRHDLTGQRGSYFGRLVVHILWTNYTYCGRIGVIAPIWAGKDLKSPEFHANFQLSHAKLKHIRRQT